LVFVLGAGKLAMVLGAAGQGQSSTLPWATAYLGAGPWGSLAPEVPSHPSQAYEGIVTLAILAVLSIGLWRGALQARDGGVFAVAVAAWAVGRAAVSVTWRDEAAGLGLSVGGLIAAIVGLAFLGGLVILARPGPGPTGREPGTREVGWADPETRPRF
jgi:prolipoprotein diacylglyceryltransferase